VNNVKGILIEYGENDDKKIDQRDEIGINQKIISLKLKMHKLNKMCNNFSRFCEKTAQNKQNVHKIQGYWNLTFV
jgi:hypothetical protein